MRSRGKEVVEFKVVKYRGYMWFGMGAREGSWPSTCATWWWGVGIHGGERGGWGYSSIISWLAVLYPSFCLLASFVPILFPSFSFPTLLLTSSITPCSSFHGGFQLKSLQHLRFLRLVGSKSLCISACRVIGLMRCSCVNLPWLEISH